MLIRSLAPFEVEQDVKTVGNKAAPTNPVAERLTKSRREIPWFSIKRYI
jgi:hypothetical protein